MSDLDILSEIEKGFESQKYFDGDRGTWIRGVGDIVCMISKAKDDVSVFIECGTERFIDNFNSVVLESSTIDLEGPFDKVTGLELSCPANHFDSFKYLSCDLIKSVIGDPSGFDPQQWCDTWKSILGNRYSKHRIYDVIAELLVYDYMLSSGHNPLWCGPDGNRHDIFCEDFNCEVKSTVCNNGPLTIELSSGNQFVPGAGFLKLYVCQLEPAANGIYSINILTESIRNHGSDLAEIEEKLERIGLNSTKIRKQKYNLLFPIKEFIVDSDFPLLRDQDFVDGRRPERILNIRYALNLEGLDHTEIEAELREGEFDYTIISD